MANRDYFTTPNQAGGRSASDYGNSKLDGREAGRSILPWLLGVTAFWAIFFACAVIDLGPLPV